MRSRTFLLAAALLAVTPAAAQAATLHGSGGRIDYRAASGERNTFRALLQPTRVSNALGQGDYLVTDTVPFTATGDCRMVSDRAARCTNLTGGIVRLGDRDDSSLVQLGTPTLLQVLGSDGDDTFHAGAAGSARSRVHYAGGNGHDTIDYGSADRRVTIAVDGLANEGRSGDQDSVVGVEVLRGSHFWDTILGGETSETIEGRNGGDIIRAGGGNDIIVEGRFRGLGQTSPNGPDLVSGGPGQDFVTYAERVAPVRVTFEGRNDIQNDGAAGEGDNLMNDLEGVTGGRGGDTLSAPPTGGMAEGGPGNDRLSGNPGRDVLIGGPGRDLFGGLGGPDVILARDGEADAGDCGTGFDQLDRDFADRINACEQDSAVGTFRLRPRTLTARPGRAQTVTLRWTHPGTWRQLDAVRLVLRDRGRRVGQVTLDQESERLTARGSAVRVIGGRSSVDAAGPLGRTVTVRLALRISRRYAGRRLTAELGATQDGGARQAPRRAGVIRVTRR